MACQYSEPGSKECNKCPCKNCWKAAKGKYCNKHWFGTHGSCDKGYRETYIECNGGNR